MSTSMDIYTDSRYLINGITKWVYGWQKNNWKTKKLKKGTGNEFEDVLNKDLWQKLVELVDAASARGFGEASSKGYRFGIVQK